MGKRINIVRKGDCGIRTKELIARYYLDLMREFYNQDRRLFLSMDRGDMFHYAITLILQDSAFQGLTSDEAIMDRIRRRIRNVVREITQDHNQMSNQDNTIDYADNLQAKEGQAI